MFDWIHLLIIIGISIIEIKTCIDNEGIYRTIKFQIYAEVSPIFKGNARNYKLFLNLSQNPA